MGKGNSRRGHAYKAAGHWSFDPLFMRLSDEGKREVMCAQQVRTAVEDGELHPGVLLRVVSMPHRRIRADSVVDMLREGLGRDELIDRTMLPSDSKIRLPARAQRTVLSQPVPVQKPRPPVRTPQPIPALPTGPSPPVRQRHAPLVAKRRASLKTLLIIGVPLAYCVLGIGFAFFVTGDPDLTIEGIGIGLAWALLKTVGVLVGLFLWASLMLGSSRSDAVMSVGLGAFALATLLGATMAYNRGYTHLQNNQYASLGDLVERCMEAGIVQGEQRLGALCSDGWNSRSTGSGTCSRHGGVLHWKYQETQTRSIAQCNAIARRISWK